MDKFKRFTIVLAKFFPIQLVLLQLKNSHFILFIWFILFGLVTQTIANKFGMPYLFLSPEYLGSVNWLSYFVLGFAIGVFFMAYHLYSYIILGPAFPFIVTFSRAFFKFSINNSFLPLLFYFFLLANIYDVQHREELVGNGEIFVEMLSLTAGIVAFILICVFYFFKTNVDIFKIKNRKNTRYTYVNSLFGKRKYWFNTRATVTYQPSYYFSSMFRISLARDASHYDRTVIRDIFRQNHLNASLFEIIIIISFLLLSLLQEFRIVVIPAGASFFLLMTLILMFVSIFYSWFKSWALSLIFISFIGLNYFSKGTGILTSKSKAYGLSYKNKVIYNLDSLKTIQFDEAVLKQEIVYHENILKKWKIKARAAQGATKPKLIIVNCSGGGLRSAMWTNYVLQELDKNTEGVVLQSTHMLTGASGGMVGAAYYRAISQVSEGDLTDRQRENVLRNISSDMLNNVAFNLVSHDLFLRYRKLEFDNEFYLKDRGFAFEQKLNVNTQFVMNKDLGDYHLAELNSEIPLMIFSPTIINDGRRLIISSQPMSFLNGLNFTESKIGPENIEYIKLFKDNNPLRIKFTSVLRMNSTFPYVLPAVAMPTLPETYIMDAGIRDNYGTKTSIRYLAALKDWIKENTSGVILIEIRDINKDYDLGDKSEYSLFDRVIKPVGNFYGNYLHAQEYDAAELLALTKRSGLKVDAVTFVLRKDPNERISLSWHLTQREKNDIIKTFHNEYNQNEMNILIDLLQP
ncbi:hypothetical protein [Crocinitomix catalasitica]|uniref:hypothetical protein n=1 Tax=Crocinitomix catalasitica TaxID=184607 RepID=UPI0004867717|nr:hypothetical protein [Crocinitomix catalasitica]